MPFFSEPEVLSFGSTAIGIQTNRCEVLQKLSSDRARLYSYLTLRHLSSSNLLFRYTLGGSGSLTIVAQILMTEINVPRFSLSWSLFLWLLLLHDNVLWTQQFDRDSSQNAPRTYQSAPNTRIKLLCRIICWRTQLLYLASVHPHRAIITILWTS